MKVNKLNIAIVTGLIAIVGILVAQLLWIKQAYTLEERKFSQKVHVALLEVAYKIYKNKDHDIPLESPVEKVSNDYYLVNIQNDFEPEILEIYLRTEFEKRNILTDFEYAMYNCTSDRMVYGNYVSFGQKSDIQRSVQFPKHTGMVYYFAIRFPNQTTYLFSSLTFWVTLSAALIIILVVYVYSVFIILQQKKYSELQRDFINNMTHEFKTPLSSILIASNYLITQNSIKKDDRLNKYTEIIIRQSGKLNEHIEKILDIARSDVATPELSKTDIVLKNLLEEVFDNIKLKHPTLEYNIAIDENIRVSADAFHLSNLIYNLADNSIKYNRQMPVIQVEVKSDKNGYTLDFSDNGVGIPEKHLPYVFDKFFRIPGQTNGINGFGLGLYYVKKVCTLHGWKINAGKNNSGGTTITIQMK